MEAKGKMMIKIVSVLFIISGGFSTITYLFVLLFGSAGAASGAESGQGKGVAMVLGLMVLYLIWSILMLIGGVLGMKNCGKPEAARMLVAIGIILIIASLVVNIYRIVVEGANMSTILPLVASVVLPVLYIIGAKKNLEH